MEGILKRSAYRKNIERWEAVFRPEQVLYLPYRRIRPEPEAMLREVEAFVGAAPWSYDDLPRTCTSRRDDHRARRSRGARGAARPERAWLRARFGPGFLS